MKPNITSLVFNPCKNARGAILLGYVINYFIDEKIINATITFLTNESLKIKLEIKSNTQHIIKGTNSYTFSLSKHKKRYVSITIIYTIQTF